MGITRVRGRQIRGDTLSGAEIRDLTITGDDIAPGSLTGDKIVDSSIDSSKIDFTSVAPTLAGNGLSVSGQSLNINFNSNFLDISSNVLSFNLTTATVQGNVFNGPNQLVQLDGGGALPAIDGSNLIGVGQTIVFVDQEVPAGNIDGANKVFTLAFTPSAGSLHFYFNGILIREGAGNDYTMSGNTITMALAPNAGSVLLASYRK